MESRQKIWNKIDYKELCISLVINRLQLLFYFEMFELGNTLDTVCTVRFVEFYYINQQMHKEFDDDT